MAQVYGLDGAGMEKGQGPESTFTRDKTRGQSIKIRNSHLRQEAMRSAPKGLIIERKTAPVVESKETVNGKADRVGTHPMCAARTLS